MAIFEVIRRGTKWNKVQKRDIPLGFQDSKCSDYVTHHPGQTNSSDISLSKEESKAKNTKTELS